MTSTKTDGCSAAPSADRSGYMLREHPETRELRLKFRVRRAKKKTVRGYRLLACNLATRESGILRIDCSKQQAQ